MKIYLVRHGESDTNASRTHSTSTTPLTEKGRKQAEFVGKRLSGVPIDIIYCSPFTRTRETLEIINSHIKNTKTVFTELIRERKRPSEIEGKPWDDPEIIKIKKEITEKSSDPSWRFSDEETIQDLKKRADDFKELLGNATHDNVLVVTHGFFIHVFVAVLCFGDEWNPSINETFDKFFAHQNTGITLLEKNNDRWELITWNDHAHLAEPQ